MATDRSPRRRPGSATRLAVLHALFLTVVLGAAVVAMSDSFARSYQRATLTRIGTELREFETHAQARPPGQSLRAFAVNFLSGSPVAADDIVVVSVVGDGLVVTGGSGPLLTYPAVSAWFRSPPPRTMSFMATIAGTTYEVVGAPLRSGGRAVGTYVQAKDMKTYVAERARVTALAAAEAGLALLVGVTSAYLLLRRLLRAVGRITTTAHEIGEGRLERRLGDQGTNDEVAQLARTFDGMLDRLEEAMQAQRRLLADVSHQLRTPLTVVRGHLEVLARTGTSDPAALHEAIGVGIDELDHMTSLVDRLLMLGRALEPGLLVAAPVPVQDLLEGVRDSLSVLANDGLALGRVEPIFLLADRDQLRGAVVNLVGNALRAAKAVPAGAGPAGAGSRPSPGPRAAVVLSGTALPSGDVELVVEDSGPGIPPAQREAALRRFSRPGAREEDGSGLGLAIAKAVALAHGGSISIDRSEALGGARVAIVLPASRVLGGRTP